MPIEFGRQVCGSLSEASAREWLVTDGLGGYAMGTVAGLRTRRYHGLLMVAGEAAGGGDAGVSRRMLGLAALDPTLVIGDRRIRLATDEWASGVIDPAGHVELESFTLSLGIPKWRWVIGDITFEREIAMMHGRPAVAVRHRLVHASGAVRVELTPLCTWRDGHGDRKAGGDPAVEAVADGFVFEHAYRVSGLEWIAGGSWYRGVRARAEAERGLGDTEDLWAAGCLTALLHPGESADVVAWAGDLDRPPPSAAEIVTSAQARAARVESMARPADEVDALLARRAADQFVVTTSTGPSVVAGYPWFGEWSRDTMTSYEGLFLCTGRYEEGRDLLLRSAATVSEGMLANTADAGGLEYNTADGTLWFIHAVGRHVAVTGDLDLLAKLDSTLDTIIDAHSHGTRFGIQVDPSDGLLQQGAPGWALTWMDARVDGQPITARAGKAVDINALWVNALGTVSELRRRLGRHAGRWQSLAEFARSSFLTRFARRDHLLDVVGTTGTDDSSVRPNQLLALSLPRGPFAGSAAGGSAHTDLAVAVVSTCRSELLTSLGLRSLSPRDPAYTGRHRGGPAERDAAYHQGTVWPWLIGPFVDAACATGEPPADVLDGLVAHLGEFGLGSVSETADGDAPHGATGCPFQAWSVAELLRARRVLSA